MMNRRIAVIPAYEPDDKLLSLLAKIRKCGFEAIVVDDGSGPAYREIFEKAKMSAVVLTHTENRGKGRALKTAFSCIMEHFSEEPEQEEGSDLTRKVVVTLDADGQHTLTDALNVCEAARSHPGTLVLGSRRMVQAAPLRSRLGNGITRKVYRLFTGNAVYDTQTGLRAFTLGLLPEFLTIEGERYEYEMNVLLYCSQKQIPILEKPIETIYVDNNAGSHFHPLSDSVKVYAQILKFALSSLAGFAVDYLVYALMLMATGSMEAAVGVTLANVVARILSAAVNFTLNRRLVFQNKGAVWKAAAQYAALAVAILAGNTLVLNALVAGVGLHPLVAKLVTEIAFFTESWLVQKYIIFRKGSAPVAELEMTSDCSEPAGV